MLGRWAPTTSPIPAATLRQLTPTFNRRFVKSGQSVWERTANLFPLHVYRSPRASYPKWQPVEDGACLYVLVRVVVDLGPIVYYVRSCCWPWSDALLYVGFLLILVRYSTIRGIIVDPGPMLNQIMFSGVRMEKPSLRAKFCFIKDGSYLEKFTLPLSRFMKELWTINSICVCVW